ncbi:MAG TPA: YciI family protein [Candidatus Limnocylindrales bacterium]|nr:YciI family protein [Candidatus Limnocylindrales bacterium]
MRYMLLIYTREDERAIRTEEQMEEIKNGHLAAMQEARGKGVLEAAEPLAGTRTATTVRLQNGKPLITDGPFAETREQLAGYYILDCRDLDEAIVWAQKIPTGCGGLNGCVEIRPLPGLGERPMAMAGNAAAGTARNA